MARFVTPGDVGDGATHTTAEILFLVDESHKELTGGFQIGKHSECLHPLDAPSQHLPPDGDSDPADSKGGARPLSGVPSEARPNMLYNDFGASQNPASTQDSLTTM